jgi:AraC-like DNA-binding protein
MGLNPNYTSGLFQKTFGTTISAFITEHRISHAQRLLITTDSKILEIALASGFNTLSRFNRAFLERCGCTPREYRQNHRITPSIFTAPP